MSDANFMSIRMYCVGQMASLSVACSDMRYVHGRAQHSALWMTCDRGGVFVHDADQYQLDELPTEM